MLLKDRAGTALESQTDLTPSQLNPRAIPSPAATEGNSTQGWNSPRRLCCSPSSLQVWKPVPKALCLKTTPICCCCWANGALGAEGWAGPPGYPSALPAQWTIVTGSLQHQEPQPSSPTSAPWAFPVSAAPGFQASRDVVSQVFSHTSAI